MVHPAPPSRARRVADLPVIGYVLAPWSLLSEVRAALLRHGVRLTALEKKMASMNDALAEAARVVGLVKAEVASLRDQLVAEQSDDDAEVAAAREADAARLSELVGVLAEALPAAVPDVPAPGPGQPATDPETGQTSDEVIANPPPAADGSEQPL